jgi:hypothetical protein
MPSLDMQYDFPHYPRIDEVTLTEAERAMWIDLTPYMNQSPPVVYENAPAIRYWLITATLYVH